MDNRVSSNKKNVTFSNQDVNQKQLVENSGEFGTKKVFSKNPVNLFMSALQSLKAFIMKPIHNRQIKACNNDLQESRLNRDLDWQINAYNNDLQEYRLNRDLDKIMKDANLDMEWYEDLRDRIGGDESLEKELIEKNSEEIHEIFLRHGIITIKESDQIKKDRVDLEGSPYW